MLAIRRLIPFIFLFLLNQSLNAQVNLESNLIGYWCLDGNALDASDNAYDGTILGAQSTKNRLGNDDQAFEFDGVNDEITINHSFNELTIPFSVSGWIYKKDATEIKHIFSTSSQPTIFSGIYFSVYSDEALRISYGDGGPEGSFSRRTKISSSKVPLETWVYVTAVVNGPTDIDLYINCSNAGGFYDGSGGDMVHSSAVARIGRATHENFWEGKIDALRLYNRALNDEEIIELCKIESCEGKVCDYIAPPNISSPIYICDSDLGKYEVIAAGSEITWFDEPALSKPIGFGNSFYPQVAMTYYATQTINECRSEATIVEITNNGKVGSPLPESSVVSVCQSEIIDLSLSGTDLKWYDDVSLTNQVSPNDFFVNENQMLYVTQSINGCTGPAATLYISIEESKPPIPDFSGNIFCIGSELSIIGENIKWYDEANNLIFQNSNQISLDQLGEKKYLVTQTVNSCESEFLELKLSVTEFNNDELFIPNAFSPNGDQLNESFYLPAMPTEKCLGVFNRVIIINSYGQPIFESANRSFNWKPYDMNGTFYYLIEFEEITIKGFVQIVK